MRSKRLPRSSTNRLRSRQETEVAMNKKTLQFVLPALFLFLLIATVVLPKRVDDTQMTVHEWGTFTSVSGDDGRAIQWRTYGGSGDLPCFVYSFGGIKGNLFGSVRMETPVLYFYSPRNSVANVKVRFPKGTITEWYPKESGRRIPDSIEWHNIQIAPEAAPD